MTVLEAADPLAEYEPGPPPPPQPVATRAEISASVTPIEAGAERSVLAAVMGSSSFYDDVCEKLVAADFGAPAHEAVYAAIVSCDAQGRPFDPVTVADEMRRAGTLHRAGGEAYLTDIMRSASSPEAVAAHVEIILDRSLRRRMLSAAHSIGTAAMNPALDASQALDAAEQQVFDLGQKREESSLAPMAQVIAKTQEQMAKARTGQMLGYSTGLARLDEITGGLRPGRLIIVAARPSMGKSVLALQMAAHVADVEDVTVPFFCYEMSHEEMGLRLLASRLRVSLSDLGKGVIPTSEGMDRMFAHEVERLSRSRLLIDDRPPKTISGLRSKVRQIARRGPIGPIFIDYLQLLNGDGMGGRNENRAQEVSYISRALQQMSVEVHAPVVALSQLGRQVDSRPNRRPMMADLRESGALEQDASQILAIYRDYVYDKSASPTESEILVLKNRQGETGEIPVDFEGRYARFDDSTRVLSPGGGGDGAGDGFAAGAAGGFGGGGGGQVKRPSFW